jgi:hypothetical protein
LLLFVAACSPAGDKVSAEKATARFHALYDAGQTATIYREASDGLRRSTPQRDMDRLLQQMHRSLGAMKRSRQTSWSTNYGTGGGTAVLVYSTDFALGPGDERFIYQLGAGGAKLLRYDIRSPLLH